MENLTEKLKSLKEEDYKTQKVNLHIHTSCSDGAGNYNQIVKSAKEKAYKLIAITDHNTVEAHKNIQDEILLTGAEFDCWYGYVYIHLLAYGIDINNEGLKSYYSKNKIGTESMLVRLFPRRNVSDLIKAIHNAGGLAVLAHPACYWALSLEKLVKDMIQDGLDGIEVYYPYPRFRKYIRFHSAQEVKDVANKYPQLIQTGGTDFHGKEF